MKIQEVMEYSRTILESIPEEDESEERSLHLTQLEVESSRREIPKVKQTIHVIKVNLRVNSDPSIIAS